MNSSNITVPFGSDDSRSLVVSVHTISGTKTLNGDVVLLPNNSSIISLIDSTVPHIWLPQAICDRFEQAFGLTYDTSTDLYLVDDDAHSKLVALSPSVTVSLSIGLGSDNPQNLDIELPYAAFDLEASSPIYPNATKYFPIRRAANDTQYTLGRTFLQEAYIVVDYERSKFSVHKATFQDPMPNQHIITIASLSDSSSANATNPNGGKSKDRVSSGAIAGIAIGAVAGAVLIIALCWWLFRRHRYVQVGQNKDDDVANELHVDSITVPAIHDKMVQLDDTTRHEMPSSYQRAGVEMPAGHVPYHFSSGSATPRSELPNTPAPEPPSRDISRHELPS